MIQLSSPNKEQLVNPTDDITMDDLAPVEVLIKDKDGKVKYILREASADAAVKYRNATIRGSVIDTANKKVVAGENANAEAIAVAACLFEMWDPNKPARPVLLTTVLGWKNSFVKQLFDRLVAISPGLILSGDTEATAAKNEQPAGTDS